MIGLWQRSLLFRTVASIVAITVIVGGLLVMSLSVLVAQRAEDDAYKRLGELIDTIESTVQIACFVGDEQLATEVARGLLKNREINAVLIRSDRGELINLSRTDNTADSSVKGSAPLQRQVFSPFDKKQVVGDILLYPDVAAIEAQITTAKIHIVSQIGVLIAAVAIALTLTAFRLVIRPISDLSNRMHTLDAESGEKLQPPSSHEYNLIGLLTEDINGLTARLVDTIHTEQALRRQHEIDERKYRGIFENAESGIFVANSQGKMESYNRSLSRLTSLPLPERSACSVLSLLNLAWANPSEIANLIATCIERNEATAGDFELRHPEQGSRWLNVALTALGADLVQGIVSDVTVRRNAEVRAQRLAITDPLTGLPNRLGFEQHWQEQIRQCPDKPFALFVADLDGFREINDAMGFSAGDKVLLGIAARFLTSLKVNDFVTRLGGDDFVIVLPGVNNPSAIEKVAKRLIQKVTEPFLINDQETCLSISIGVACFPADGNNLPTLLRNAELALAQAQASGGRTWRTFDPSMVQAAEHRHQLATDLRGAAERDELRLYYQPIVDLDDLRVTGAECLIRWQHPQHGLVAPDNFIPLAEETGLIKDIGLWCLESACQQLVAWDKLGLGLDLTINVSACQIPDGLSAQIVSDTLAQYGLSNHRIGLEITESTLVGDGSAAEEWLAALRAQGSRVYLDDFGTGYSSLSYLKRFKVDTIKIDKTFIRDLSEDSNDRVMVEAVSMMADSLKLSVVAEGIETAQQLEMLRQMGCRYGQGYFFSRPVPPEQFPEQIERIDRSNQPALI